MRRMGFVHLGIVYLLWGTTFLAIRVAVREGSGFAPFIMAGTRVLIASAILFAIAWIAKQRLRPTRAELFVVAAAGLLLWTGANGLVTWSEQRVHAGPAALVIATMPIWACLMEAYLDRRSPSLLLLASLGMALLGVAVLSVPFLTSGVRADSLSILALLLAALSWAAGTVVQSRRPVKLGIYANSAYQNLFGALGFLTLSFLLGEPASSPIAEAWIAWAYLIVFGSVIGFTSYVQTIRLLPLSVATTNAYVNPLVAVILGAIILSEPITGYTLVGTVLVLLGVAGVFRDRFRTQRTLVAEAAD
ncbi:MAG: drug/metabolite exporter YedA [Anaerolineae bacterium]|nr:MAG: drug/metabolite exporter YedA [Anaerolineae bacterium]